MGLNAMSDWTMEEYYSILGLLPEGEYPREIIDDNDSSWKDDYDSTLNTKEDKDLENKDYWPKEFNKGGDRPMDNLESPILLNSLFFWGNKKNETVNDAEFYNNIEEEEKKYKEDRDIENVSIPDP
jgi:hypothetical protein